jgi:cyclic pyranopterin monophosphate synthase
MNEHDHDLSFSHFDAKGKPRMVDVSEKPSTTRIAVAEGFVDMALETRKKIEENAIHKGNVLSIAELAGIMGAKHTPQLIPLCHPIPLQKVEVSSEWVESKTPGSATLRLEAAARAFYQTGVEMEALTACTTAALTVYDMCKSVDKKMMIHSIRLVYKSGGKSGIFDVRDEALPYR